MRLKILLLSTAAAVLLPSMLPADDPPRPGKPIDEPEGLVIPDGKELQVFNVTGQDVTINCHRTRVIITGECGTLTVNGNGNVVSVQNVSNVVVNGSNNKVEWNNSGSSKPEPSKKDNGWQNITHPGG